MNHDALLWPVIVALGVTAVVLAVGSFAAIIWLVVLLAPYSLFAIGAWALLVLAATAVSKYR